MSLEREDVLIIDIPLKPAAAGREIGGVLGDPLSCRVRYQSFRRAEAGGDCYTYVFSMIARRE